MASNKSALSFVLALGAAALTYAADTNTAHAYSVDCKPTQVFERPFEAGGTAWIICNVASPSAPNVFFYGIAADAPTRHNFLSLATAALLSNRTFRIWTNDTPTTWCATSGCRQVGQYELVR